MTVDAKKVKSLFATAKVTTARTRSSSGASHTPSDEVCETIVAAIKSRGAQSLEVDLCDGLEQVFNFSREEMKQGKPQQPAGQLIQCLKAKVKSGGKVGFRVSVRAKPKKTGGAQPLQPNAKLIFTLGDYDPNAKGAKRGPRKTAPA